MIVPTRQWTSSTTFGGLVSGLPSVYQLVRLAVGAPTLPDRAACPPNPRLPDDRDCRMVSPCEAQVTAGGDCDWT